MGIAGNLSKVLQGGTARATGASAGTPGTWTGGHSVASVAVLQAGGITASPSTRWAAGTYIQTDDDGLSGRAYWDGTAWVAGVSPPATLATAGTPGTWNLAPPASVAALIAGTPVTVVASPLTLWTVGQYVATVDAAHAHWNGTAWASGEAPA